MLSGSRGGRSVAAARSGIPCRVMACTTLAWLVVALLIHAVVPADAQTHASIQQVSTAVVSPTSETWVAQGSWICVDADIVVNMEDSSSSSSSSSSGTPVTVPMSRLPADVSLCVSLNGHTVGCIRTRSMLQLVMQGAYALESWVGHSTSGESGPHSLTTLHVRPQDWCPSRPAPATPKVVACILFHNEVDMLRLFLEQVAPHVDKVVVVEAPVTHSGHTKPLHFQNNFHLFRRFRSKLHPVVFSNISQVKGGDWSREGSQREACLQGFEELHLQPQDVAYIADVDEIPRAEVLQRVRRCDIPLPAFLSFTHMSYSVNWATEEPWRKALLVEVGWLAHHSVSTLRNRGTNVIPDAGWHLTYFASLDGIHTKLASFAHASEPRFAELRELDWLVCAGLALGVQYHLEQTFAYTQYPALPQALRSWKGGSAGFRDPLRYHAFSLGGRMESVVSHQWAPIAVMVTNPVVPPTPSMVATLCNAGAQSLKPLLHARSEPRSTDGLPLSTRLQALQQSAVTTHPHAMASLRSCMAADAALNTGLAAQVRVPAPDKLSSPSSRRVNAPAGIVAVVDVPSHMCLAVTSVVLDSLHRALCVATSRTNENENENENESEKESESGSGKENDAEGCLLPGEWGARVMVVERAAEEQHTHAAGGGAHVVGTACGAKLATFGLPMVHTPWPDWLRRDSMDPSDMLPFEAVNVAVVDASRLWPSDPTVCGRGSNHNSSGMVLECCPWTAFASRVAVAAERWWAKASPAHGATLLVTVHVASVLRTMSPRESSVGALGHTGDAMAASSQLLRRTIASALLPLVGATVETPAAEAGAASQDAGVWVNLARAVAKDGVHEAIDWWSQRGWLVVRLQRTVVQESK